MLPEFDGNKKKYLNLSALCAIYSVLSVYGLFALTKYIVEGETRYLQWPVLLGLLMVTVVYTLLHARIMSQYDGLLSSGRGWKMVSSNVKLPERRRAKRFG